MDQFLDLETVMKYQSLDPETNETCKCLDAPLEIDVMDNFLGPKAEIINFHIPAFKLNA